VADLVERLDRKTLSALGSTRSTFVSLFCKTTPTAVTAPPRFLDQNFADGIYRKK
jgi:hypothetical protein